MAYVQAEAIANTLMAIVMTATGRRANATGLVFNSIKMAGTKARGTMANGKEGFGTILKRKPILAIKNNKRLKFKV